MPFLSLRFALGLLSAVTVALVASVTLSIALTSSFDALHKLGTKHAEALLQAAEDETTALFRKPEGLVNLLTKMMESKEWGLPSESPRTMDAFRDVIHAALIEHYPVICVVSIYFRDNTVLEADTTSMPGRGGEYLYKVIEASNYTRDYPEQTLTTHMNYHSLEDHRLLRSEVDPSRVVWTRNSSLWQQFYLATYNGFAASMLPPVALYVEEDVSVFIPSGAPLYPAGIASRTQDNLMGFSIIQITPSYIAGFLQRAKSTPNTEAFAYDRGQFLLGTSEAASYFVSRPLTGSVPEGCASTAEYADASNFQREHRLMCRLHVSAYPSAALNEVATRRPAFLRPAVGEAVVERMSDVGDATYAAVVRVPLAFRGLEVYLLLLMPEADIVGDVVASRNLAIGVTCGLVVLAAAINVAVVWALLAPLGGIAERMVRAANLEDDDADASVSAMAEVAELQRAYYAMNDELNRIRSYVPQSVLAARKVARGDDDEDADLQLEVMSANASAINVSGVHTGGGVSPSNSRSFTADTGSVRSSRSRKPPRSPMAAAAATQGLTVVNGRSVSVIAANVVGLHAERGQPGDVAAVVAAVAAHVEGAATARQGVVTFHGDRFLATFNAARPCGGHASKAAAAAVALADTSGLAVAGVRVAAGVATGACAVGPMGSATMKTLSTVGPAVSNAAALERLTRVHAGAAVLATHRTCADAATAVGVRYVDLVALQAKDGGMRPGVVAELRALRREGDGSTADAEWMYVLQGDASGAHAAYNAAFEALQRGDGAGTLAAYAAAEAAVAERVAATSKTDDAVSQMGSIEQCPPRLMEIVKVLRDAGGSGGVPDEAVRRRSDW